MTDRRFLEPDRRPLTESQRRLLQSRIRGFRASGRRARAASVPIVCGVIGVLWLLTIWASDAPWPIVTAFWIVVGGSIALWVRRDLGKDERRLGDMAAGLESALNANAADVYDIRARSFALFEEIEDEGACYAFELEGNRLVFVTGQEFYESARFPSLDFSLVYVVDEAGRTVDMVVEKRGGTAAPARTIPSTLKARIELPEHLEVRSGTLDTLEAVLAARF